MIIIIAPLALGRAAAGWAKNKGGHESDLVRSCTYGGAGTATRKKIITMRCERERAERLFPRIFLNKWFDLV